LSLQALNQRCIIDTLLLASNTWSLAVGQSTCIK